MHDTIRATGSQQLVTVGQDEGGIQDRLSPAFWGESVDFTTNHSWWQNDLILWDSLAAKQPGEAMLIQETGLQRELNIDEIARRTTESEAALLERKVAASFIQGSGAIEWLWNTNSDMTESNKTPSGPSAPITPRSPRPRCCAPSPNSRPRCRSISAPRSYLPSQSSPRRPPNILCSPTSSWRPNRMRFVLSPTAFTCPHL